tara:strand:- start:438 stop:623 length:186 start_codon:yes stop_codon:yes gene_type:complete
MMPGGDYPINFGARPLSDPIISASLRLSICIDELFGKRNFAFLIEWVKCWVDAKGVVFAHD